MDSRHQQITELVKELRRWVGGLADDRVQIGRSVVNISSMTSTLADFITDGRPLLKSDIAELRRLSGILARGDTKAVVKKILTNLPEMLEDQTRTGTYGSWYNYYVCGAKVNIELPRELSGPQHAHQRAEELHVRLHGQAMPPGGRPMRGRSDFQIKRIGAIALVVALLLMGAALNLQKFPGFRGTGYRPSSATPAACTRATWCRSPASGSAASAASTSPGTTSSSTSRSTTE